MAGLGLPFGIITGFGSYTALAAFLHAGVKPDRSDLPRLMIIIALLTAVVAHYLEIHFGIRIGATRTHFWILIAVLMLVGMRLLPVLQNTPTANTESDFLAAESPAPPARRGKAATPPPSRRARPDAGSLPRTGCRGPCRPTS
jgi:hypothetical protein